MLVLIPAGLVGAFLTLAFLWDQNQWIALALAPLGGSLASLMAGFGLAFGRSAAAAHRQASGRITFNERLNGA